MENYENLGTIGEGTYGVVLKCRHKETGQIVAIKKFKESDDDEQVRKTAFREIRLLKQLKHENIVNLIEVFRRKGKLYLVFEFVEKTILEELETNPEGLKPNNVAFLMWQLIRAIDFCHDNNIIHRDIKPENLLVSKHGVLKLCDFGFARPTTEIDSNYTDYVSTRWYRSPELLVGDITYGKPVDVWASGCMFAEITNGLPLFPGESDIDQLYHIMKCFGRITSKQRDFFKSNPLYVGVKLPEIEEMDTLETRFPNVSSETLELMKNMLQIEPLNRSNCKELLNNKFFLSQKENFEKNLQIALEKDNSSNFIQTTNQDNKKKMNKKNYRLQESEEKRKKVAIENESKNSNTNLNYHRHSINTNNLITNVNGLLITSNHSIESMAIDPSMNNTFLPNLYTSTSNNNNQIKKPMDDEKERKNQYKQQQNMEDKSQFSSQLPNTSHGTRNHNIPNSNKINPYSSSMGHINNKNNNIKPKIGQNMSYNKTMNTNNTNNNHLLNKFSYTNKLNESKNMDINEFQNGIEDNTILKKKNLLSIYSPKGSKVNSNQNINKSANIPSQESLYKNNVHYDNKKQNKNMFLSSQTPSIGLNQSFTLGMDTNKDIPFNNISYTHRTSTSHEKTRPIKKIVIK